MIDVRRLFFRPLLVCLTLAIAVWSDPDPAHATPPAVGKSIPVVGSSVNILIEGQSNADYFLIDNGGAALASRVQKLLGFDGVNQTVSILGGHDLTCWGGSYVVSAVRVPQSLTWLNGNAASGWSDAPVETAFISYLKSLPPAVTARPTVILWLHNENDSLNPALTAATWESAVRFNVTEARAAFGQGAPTMPLDITYVPFDWNPGVNEAAGRSPEVQALKAGFEALSADAAFNAAIAAQIGDANMDGPPGMSNPYGAKHFDQADINIAASRIAVTIANQFWQYARPGSVEAAAQGTLDAIGPQVVSASIFPGNALLVQFALPVGGGGLAALSPGATAGAGWSIVDGSQVIYANKAARVGRKLILGFASPVPHTPTARLYYGWGTGRIFAETTTPVPPAVEGPGQGQAIYNLAGLPVWTVAGGVPVK